MMDEPKPNRPEGEPASGPAVFALTLVLVAVAGWIDALGFVVWHGLFVGFMSGNTIQVGAGVGGDWSVVVASGRAVLLFVAGVIGGDTIGATGGRWGRASVLLAESAALWLGTAADLAGGGEALTASVLGLAMGLQTAVIEKAAGESVALTYVTGTLVKIGRGVSRALRGAGSWSVVLPGLGLWAAFLAGALGGGAMTRFSEAGTLIAAAAVVSALALVAGIATAKALKE